MASLNDLVASISNFFNGSPHQSAPIPSVIGDPSQMKMTIGHPLIQEARAQAPIPSPSQMPTRQPANLGDLGEKIRAGFRKWNGGQPVPMEQYIPQIIQESQKYPIFQKYPYLIPAVSIVETGAGKNWQLNHNPLSWAARAQQAGQYTPNSDMQSIMDMITAVGGDQNRGQGFAPDIAQNRLRQIQPYEQFRNTGNLEDFTNVYEPPQGNPNYYPALQKAMGYFQ